MKTKILIVITAILLVACTSAQSVPAVSETEIYNTAIAIVQTNAALTQTALPSITPPPPTVTPTATVVVIPPTPPPTQPPIPILTPDAIQVERWREYQKELAMAVFSFTLPHKPSRDHNPEEYQDALCEWDILGRMDREVYVWTVCHAIDDLESGTSPAVIYLEPDGSIREVYTPEVGMDRDDQYYIFDLHLFPVDVQEKLCRYYFLGFVPQCHSIIPNYG